MEISIGQNLDQEETKGLQHEGRIARVCSVVQIDRGTEVVEVDACSIQGGYSGIKLLGNVSTVCGSAVERAESALRRSGIEVSASRIVISFSPGDLRIEGSQFDLAIAVLLSHIQSKVSTKFRKNQRWVFHAELALDGKLRPSRGAIAAVIASIQSGCDGIICAKEQAQELAKITTLIQENHFKCLAFENLSEVLKWYFSEDVESNLDHNQTPADDVIYPQDFDDMNIDENLQEAAVIAAAGFHSILLYGPPGSGKTMFAQRLASIVPKLDGKRHLQALNVHSQAYAMVSKTLLHGCVPFRSPHHSASYSAIIGNQYRPGELALATGGILFLDEFPEFRRDVLESLREPLESKKILISRALYQSEEDLEFLFIAAANPCPCGWLGSKRRVCKCMGKKVYSYQHRMSGPILDRIELHLYLESDVPDSKKNAAHKIGQTDSLRKRVRVASEFAKERNHLYGIVHNSEIKTKFLADCLRWKADKLQEVQELLSKKLDTIRSINKTLRVARSIADLYEEEVVRDEHFTKALRWTKSIQKYAP